LEFFFLGLSGRERANLVLIAIEEVEKTGAKAVSLTADGPSTHLTMMRELGAKLDPDNMVPFFPNPSHPSRRVHVILDLVHMLKLVRNSLGSSRIIKSPSGLVKWEYIENLHNLQEEIGLRAGTKIKKQHIEWQRNKMKVSIAAQTLSTSVADALDFLREDLKMNEFQDSKATSEFIRLFDRLFDIFNSRSFIGRNFKAPLKLENQHEWLSLFAEASLYIKQLQKLDGTPILASKIKTGYLGFLCGIVTFQNLFQDLVLQGSLDYILTYKFSQVNFFTLDFNGKNKMFNRM
jgi:hypothetical protein